MPCTERFSRNRIRPEPPCRWRDCRKTRASKSTSSRRFSSRSAKAVALQVSGLSCPSCALDSQYPVHPAKRFDHLLEVLQIADFNRDVDPGILAFVGPRLHVPDVGVDIGDLR